MAVFIFGGRPHFWVVEYPADERSGVIFGEVLVVFYAFADLVLFI